MFHSVWVLTPIYFQWFVENIFKLHENFTSFKFNVFIYLVHHFLFEKKRSVWNKIHKSWAKIFILLVLVWLFYVLYIYHATTLCIITLIKLRTCLCNYNQWRNVFAKTGLLFFFNRSSTRNQCWRTGWFVYCRLVGKD